MEWASWQLALVRRSLGFPARFRPNLPRPLLPLPVPLLLQQQVPALRFHFPQRPLLPQLRNKCVREHPNKSKIFFRNWFRIILLTWFFLFFNDWLFDRNFFRRLFDLNSCTSSTRRRRVFNDRNILPISTNKTRPEIKMESELTRHPRICLGQLRVRVWPEFGSFSPASLLFAAAVRRRPRRELL